MSEEAANPPAPEDAAPPPPEEPPMEIHKPKPVHSWREFLVEITTIVVGIVIAITLEHVVEEWQWDREVKIARQTLQAEILANNTNLLARRLAIAPCVDRLLSKTDRIIAALEAKKTPDPFLDYRLPVGFVTIENDWQSERASQVLTHFPRDELAVFSRYYAQLPDIRDWILKEEGAWAELSILQKSPAGMTAPDINRLKVNLFVAQRMERLIVRNAQRELYFSKKLGVAEAKRDDQFVENFCSDMSWDEYQRWLWTEGLGLGR
jgi:hypothetical protein